MEKYHRNCDIITGILIIANWFSLNIFFAIMYLKNHIKKFLFRESLRRILNLFYPLLTGIIKTEHLNQPTQQYIPSNFIFFHPDHNEIFNTRTLEGNINYETPRILYSQNYNMHKWAQVPLKEMYKNDVYVYDKPILIIANRYNSEWNGPPVSFFSIELLDFIIEKLKPSYTIIYNRAMPKNITMDNSDIYDLHEFEWLEENHPEVILMEDLFKENKANAKNFNHLQLMVYANANHFISTHGGTAALASYFKGINLILSKKGPEHHFGCFQKLFPKLSGAKILHAKTDEEVKSYIEQYYVCN